MFYVCIFMPTQSPDTESVPGTKRPERGADHPPHSIGLQMGWNYTAAFSLRLHMHVMG
jgi:hypothetical protein